MSAVARLLFETTTHMTAWIRAICSSNSIDPLLLPEIWDIAEREPPANLFRGSIACATRGVFFRQDFLTVRPFIPKTSSSSC